MTEPQTTEHEVITEAQREQLQSRTLKVVIASQVLGGAGLAAGVTVGALLAQDMLGRDDLSGLPAALFTLGSALAAFLVGRMTQRWGRRPGLGFGFATGGLGAFGVVVAAVLGNPTLLFIALFIYGAGTATNLQARYAGTDLALPARRGTATSIALVSTTLGAVAGPNLVEPLGALAVNLGLPALTGPFLLAGVAYLAAGAVLISLLRPDPFLVAKQLSASRQKGAAEAGPVPGPRTGAYVGGFVMVLTQIVMVAVMTMTPVHLRTFGHELGAVGLVIGLHVGAMYLPSLLTGVLVDRIGRLPIAAAGGVTLLLAGVIGAIAPGDNLFLLIVALILLGIGWNFGLISGTSLVVDATVPANRAQTQGAIDVFIALGGATGGAVSGMVMAASSYETLSAGAGLIALLVIPVIMWARGPREGAVSAA